MPCCGNLTQLVQILAAKLHHLSLTDLEAPFTGITTDTRILKPGEVFVALRGEKFDGHQFVNVAHAQGAIAIIVDAGFECNDCVPLIQVQDTLQAYQQIAAWWRQQFTIPVIGITGSAGKTTTKEIIAAVLATQGNVLKTQANYNNEIGVPKTLLELDAEHDYAVIEMAMRARGEIALLTQITSPTIGVIVNVGTAHIERLGSEDAIAQAKCELLAEMPATSVAILNHDNARLIATAAFWQGKTLTYGLEGGDLHGTLLEHRLCVQESIFSLPLPGRHNASNFLAALAVAKVLQIDWSSLSNITVNMPSGRSQFYNLANDLIILDESYNAAPEAMLAALELLAATSGKRRIAVLGAMKELGVRSQQLHFQVGSKLRELNIDMLLLLVDGADTQAIAQGAKDVATEYFSDHAAIVERLKEIVQPGDRILFKAAHSVGLDRIVNQLRAEYTAIRLDA